MAPAEGGLGMTVVFDAANARFDQYLPLLLPAAAGEALHKIAEDVRGHIVVEAILQLE